MCQAAKLMRHHTANVQPIPTPVQRFTHLHVDLVEPLPASPEGFSYIFTIVDRTTHSLEAVPLRSLAAADIADALVSGWVTWFGLPAIITSGRGVQFTSALWGAAMKKLGIKHQMATAFHPKSNGLVERTHRQLKDALKAKFFFFNFFLASGVVFKPSP
jgi:hypothetical protein